MEEAASDDDTIEFEIEVVSSSSSASLNNEDNFKQSSPPPEAVQQSVEPINEGADNETSSKQQDASQLEKSSRTEIEIVDQLEASNEGVNESEQLNCEAQRPLVGEQEALEGPLESLVELHIEQHQQEETIAINASRPPNATDETPAKDQQVECDELIVNKSLGDKLDDPIDSKASNNNNNNTTTTTDRPSDEQEIPAKLELHNEQATPIDDISQQHDEIEGVQVPDHEQHQQQQQQVQDGSGQVEVILVNEDAASQQPVDVEGIDLSVEPSDHHHQEDEEVDINNNNEINHSDDGGGQHLSAKETLIVNVEPKEEDQIEPAPGEVDDVAGGEEFYEAGAPPLLVGDGQPAEATPANGLECLLKIESPSCAPDRSVFESESHLDISRVDKPQAHQEQQQQQQPEPASPLESSCASQPGGGESRPVVGVSMSPPPAVGQPADLCQPSIQDKVASSMDADERTMNQQGHEETEPIKVGDDGGRPGGGQEGEAEIAPPTVTTVNIELSAPPSLKLDVSLPARQRRPSVVFASSPGEDDDLEREFDEEPEFERRQVVVKRNRNPRSEYQLAAELGRGRFGTVYRCAELASGRQLAAKFVHMRRKEDREDVEREVAIMSILQHKRLLQLYDAFDDGHLEMCLITELVEGGELFERIVDDDFELTEKKAAIFVRQICEGVAYMHSQNIVHLDMKPENILCLSRTGNRIKLIDFGLARQLCPEQPLRVMFGTPDFAAPEVLGYEVVTLATDMWSVGVICYVLLSGLSPFMGDNDMETMANVTRAVYDFDSQAFEPITQLAKDFIGKLLLRNPADRLKPADCLRHPWLQRGSPQLEAAVRERRQSTALQTRAAMDFAAAAAMAAANHHFQGLDHSPQVNAADLTPSGSGSAEVSSSGPSLDKRNLKKYVVRRKWHKTVHAIMALGRMGAFKQMLMS